MVSIEGVKFQYDAAGPVLSFPDFSCAQGDRMLLLGNSGAGKTTLLHLPADSDPDCGGVDGGSKSCTPAPTENSTVEGHGSGRHLPTSAFVQSLTVARIGLAPPIDHGRVPKTSNPRWTTCSTAWASDTARRAAA